MLTVNEGQMAAFSATALAQTVRRLAEFVRGEFSALAQQPPATLEAQIRESIGRAARRDIRLVGDVRRWIVLEIRSGQVFDRPDADAATKEILADPNLTPRKRLTALETRLSGRG